MLDNQIGGVVLSTSTKRASRGFTLIELMIGIVIVAITMALGMPAYKTWILNTKLRTAAESIASGLQMARSEAVRRNAPVQFTLGAGSSWIVGCVTATSSCPTSIQKRATGDGSSAAVTVTAVDGTPVVFNNFGRMTAPAPASGTTSINIGIDPAILSATESRNLRVTVGISGNVRMCDPTVTTAGDSRKC